MSEQNPEINLEVQVSAFRAEIARIKNELQSADGTIKQVDVNTLGEQHMGVWLRYKNILKEMSGVLEHVTWENLNDHESHFKKIQGELKTLNELIDVVEQAQLSAQVFTNWMRNRTFPLLANISVLLSGNRRVLTGQVVGEIRDETRNELGFLNQI